MSLDVYLTGPTAPPREHSGIFVREGGEIREVSREEWDARYPDREPFVASIAEGEEPAECYSANITHNLGKMADAVGLYEALWRPEEIGITKAEQLIPLLRSGLAALKAEPEKFRAHNPSNGWGDYEGLVRFVEGYLGACEQYPTANVKVSR